MTFENAVGKGENAGNQHFLLFLQCFLPHHRQISSFEPDLNRHLQVLLTLSQMTNFRLFQTGTKSLQTTMLNSMKMEECFSKQVENTVGKGEIARSEQFLLFPQCFQKACTADT